MQCQDTGSMEVIHVPKDTILLAKRIQELASIIQEDGRGNGEITIKLQVSGGKISKFLSFVGKWLSGNQKDK